ncbi:MAG: CAP domain-containing protein [Bdellovibrionota bacterium]
MKKLLTILAAACCLGAFSDEPKSKLEAVLVKAEGNNGYVVDIYSSEKLESPKFQHYTGTWEDFFEPVEIENRYLYRVKSYHQVTPNVILYVKSGETATTLVVPEGLNKDSEKVTLLNRGDKVAKTETRAVVQNAGASGDPGLDAINQARAARGIPPIQWDGGFAGVSQENNRRGGRHNYPGNGYQTWAGTSSPQGAVNMWLSPKYYNSHGVIILNRSITRGGTYSDGYGTTFSGR